LYGTTRLFLEHFGLNTLKELPALSEFSEHDLNEEEKERINNLPSKDISSGGKEASGGEKNEKSEKITQENRPDRQ